MRYVIIGLMLIVIRVESALASDGVLEGLGTTGIFIGGVAGAFVIYLFMYRQTRIAEFAKNPRESWRLVLVDIVLFLAAGGLVAAFTLTDPSGTEAFMAGATWQGIVGGLASGTENTELRGNIETANEKLETLMSEAERWRSLVALQQPDPVDDVQEALPQGEV